MCWWIMTMAEVMVRRFGSCCISDRREAEEEVGNVGSEHETREKS
jgi:hypothetical protein